MKIEDIAVTVPNRLKFWRMKVKLQIIAKNIFK